MFKLKVSMKLERGILLSWRFILSVEGAFYRFPPPPKKREVSVFLFVFFLRRTAALLPLCSSDHVAGVGVRRRPSIPCALMGGHAEVGACHKTSSH